MMTIEQTEAFEAVEKINDELINKYYKREDIDTMPLVSITFVGIYLFINLTIPSARDVESIDIPIYNSENDNRIYYEKSNKKESFYKFIKRKFIEIKRCINEVKL